MDSNIILNETLPTWLTAIGTIGAVWVAVRQSITRNKKKELEDSIINENSIRFIDALLTDHRLHFSHYHEFRFDENGNDLLINGETEDLASIYNLYIDSGIEKRSEDYLNDIKYGINNVGVRVDNKTLTEISLKLEFINILKTALYALKEELDAYNEQLLTDEQFYKVFRDDLRVVDVSLQTLMSQIAEHSNVEDLTDSDKN